ncbi:MAG: helix-turn-helix domain-containing protein [Pseudomonadota bacterium]
MSDQVDMAPRQGRGTIAQCHLRHALDLIVASGLDAEDVVRDIGLPRDALDGDGRRVLPLADFFRVRSYISARVRDETCNLSARQLLPGSTDFVMSHLPAEGTLADVMGIVAKSYNLLHGGEFNTVETFGGNVVFCIDDRNFPYTVKSDEEQVFFAIESTLLFLHALLTIVAPQQAAHGLSRLSVRRPAGQQAPHLDFWSVPVRYDATRYEVAYNSDQATLSVRFPPPDRLVSEAIDHQIRHLLEHGSTSAAQSLESFRGVVRELIAQGTIEQSAVALSLGISPATLRRRLTEEGVTFRDLRRAVLDEAAQALIAEGMAITAISDRLGFSDVRSFNRAFKAWHGMTPKAFQENRDVTRVEKATGGQDHS